MLDIFPVDDFVAAENATKPNRDLLNLQKIWNSQNYEIITYYRCGFKKLFDHFVLIRFFKDFLELQILFFTTPRRH